MLYHISKWANLIYIDVWGVPRNTLESFEVDLVIGPTCWQSFTAVVWRPGSIKSLVDRLKEMGAKEV